MLKPRKVKPANNQVQVWYNVNRVLEKPDSQH